MTEINKDLEVKAIYEARRIKDSQIELKELDQVDFNTDAYNLPPKVTQISPKNSSTIQEVSRTENSFS